MAANRNIFPQSIELGDTTFGDETYVGIRFEDHDGSTVTVNFTPQSLERMLDQLAALRGLGKSPGPGKGH